MQRAHLRTAQRCSISDILAVFAWIPPVQRHGSIRRQRIHIQQHTIFAVNAFAYVKNRLILHALAFRIEIVGASNLRRTNAPHGKQFRQPLLNHSPTRQRVQHAPRVGEFVLHPSLRLRRGAVLQPAVVVDDLMTVQRILHRLHGSLRRPGSAARAIRGIRNYCEQKKGSQN